MRVPRHEWNSAQLAAQRQALAEKEAELAAQGVELAEAKLRLETRASPAPRMEMEG